MKMFLAIKRGAAISFGALLLAFPMAPGAAQTAPNATGSWSVVYSGTPLTPQRLDLRQEGPAIIGTFGDAGRIDGSQNSNNTNQYDIKWTASAGNGWGTIVFGPGYTSFHGQYGYPGKKPAATFVATRIYPTFSPVNGLWNINRTGGDAFVNGVVKFTQTNLSLVGTYNENQGQFSGTFPKGVHGLTGTWKDPRGSGWVTLEFAADSKSLSGSWGMNGDTQPRGTLVGEVNNTKLPVTTGKWNVTFTGQDTHKAELVFVQHGNSMVGSWKGGHIAGSFPAGSDTVRGTWQTPKASGPVTLTFSADNDSFSGTWGYPGKPSKGRVLGQRQ
jgi:hypothetical protein